MKIVTLIKVISISSSHGIQNCK